jgi:hypothetical protein
MPFFRLDGAARMDHGRTAEWRKNRRRHDQAVHHPKMTTPANERPLAQLDPHPSCLVFDLNLMRTKSEVDAKLIPAKNRRCALDLS